MNSLKINIFLSLALLCQTYSASSNHIIGADITYKSKGNNKYLITVKMYRECSSIPISPPTFEVYNAVSNAQLSSFTPTEVAVRDITPTCGRIGKPCDPQNTTSDPGVEEHTYIYTLDFTTIINNGCCQVLIGGDECCRADKITTGASGERFWISTFINLCLEIPNSSPLFLSEPKTTLNCNQPVYHTIGAIDTIDDDSLVYELVDPMQELAKKTTWKGDKNTKMPFSVHCVGSCSLAFPNNLPPEGFYFNTQTGQLVFTPINCNETTIYSIRVSEYRKDSTGKYIKVGYITRDNHVTVSNIAGIPAKPIITQSGKTLSSNYPSGNQWYEGLTKIAGATSQNFIPKKAATYFVEYTDTAGCLTARSDPSSVLSTSKIKLSGLKIYPNPSSGSFIIEMNKPFEDVSIEVYDHLGNLIKTIEIPYSHNTNAFELDIANGIYLLRVNNGGECWSQKILILKTL